MSETAYTPDEAVSYFRGFIEDSEASIRPITSLNDEDQFERLGAKCFCIEYAFLLGALDISNRLAALRTSDVQEIMLPLYYLHNVLSHILRTEPYSPRTKDAFFALQASHTLLSEHLAIEPDSELYAFHYRWKRPRHDY